VGNRLLRRIRDYAETRARGRITADVARDALHLLEVDARGLDDMDRRMLEAIVVKYGGGPVGLGTIAVVVGEEADTLEDVYEPYLIQEGFLKRTARGREATDLAFIHLGLPPPKRNGGEEGGPGGGRGGERRGAGPGAGEASDAEPEPPQQKLF
jgi:Holliday junction DNA helicase RuvB